MFVWLGLGFITPRGSSLGIFLSYVPLAVPFNFFTHVDFFPTYYFLFDLFLSATEYHSDADYDLRHVGVVFVVVVVVHTFKNGLTFERLD